MFLGLFTLDELVNGTEYPVLSPHRHSLDCWWDSYPFEGHKELQGVMGRRPMEAQPDNLEQK